MKGSSRISTRLFEIDQSLSIPAYLQLSSNVIHLIKTGRLKPGDPLPPSRVLAKSLKVNRKTIVAAYADLGAQRWVETAPRRGLFVAEHLPLIKPKPIISDEVITPGPAKKPFRVVPVQAPGLQLFSPPGKGVISFNDGFPDTRLAPTELLIREYRRFSKYKFTDKYLMYGPEQGSEKLRVQLSLFLKETRGIAAPKENILVTKGAQMGLYLLSHVLLQKRDLVVVPEPGYFGANAVFENAGAQLQLCPVDEYGMNIAWIKKLCLRKKIRLVYVIPHHHRPTTVSLSAERRMQLLELAYQYQFAVVEDDYDYDFHYASSPILPLASADYHRNVIYIGSFCKILAPGIRVGFMVAPRNVISEATKLRAIIDRQGEQLIEEAMANLLENGDITRHLRKVQRVYENRRNHFCALLRDRLPEIITFTAPEGGLAVWGKYERGLLPAHVAQKASEKGLYLSDGTSYYHQQPKQQPWVRLGFASLTEKELAEGVQILAKTIYSL